MLLQRLADLFYTKMHPPKWNISIDSVMAQNIRPLKVLKVKGQLMPAPNDGA